jgi:hypothetical protein
VSPELFCPPIHVAQVCPSSCHEDQATLPRPLCLSAPPQLCLGALVTLSSCPMEVRDLGGPHDAPAPRLPAVPPQWGALTPGPLHAPPRLFCRQPVSPSLACPVHLTLSSDHLASPALLHCSSAVPWAGAPFEVGYGFGS